MRITRTSVLVDDQARALAFYELLGFVKKDDVPLGEFRWLTVTDPAGTELLLEPDNHPASKAFKAALHADRIPITSFTVDDLDAEHARLSAAGVVFTQEPVDAGPVRVAVLDDTCGNLVQLVTPPVA